MNKLAKGLTLGVLVLAGAAKLGNQYMENPSYNEASIASERSFEQEKDVLPKSLFEQARTDSSKRSVFLSKLFEDSNIPNCSGIVYDHDGSKIIDYMKTRLRSTIVGEKALTPEIMWGFRRFHNGNYDANTPEIHDIGKNQEQSKIFVGRRIFN